MDESKMPDLYKDLKDIEAMGEYFDYEYPNSTNFFDEFELCHINQPSNEVAQAFTTVLSIIGIFANCTVLFVMIALKEYKQSGVHWLIQQFMSANVVLLVGVLLHLINEHHNEWIMGHTMCKIDEAMIFISRSVGVVFLMLANIVSIASLSGLTKKLMIAFPLKPQKFFWILKYLLVLALVVVPCIVVNLPLYTYKNLNSCNRCLLEFPITAPELCPMLGLNSTACKHIMDFIMIGFGNITEYSAESEPYEYSGEIDTKEFDKLLEGNMSKMAEMAACKYEEPRSFYAWLFTTFAMFYALPLAILVIFGITWLCKMGSKDTYSEVNVLPVHIIFSLNMMFVICWTPWNAIHMKKAYGGLGCNGWRCVSMILYSRLAALVFNSLSPIIYASITRDFRLRLTKAFDMSTSFCYQHLLSYRESNASQESSEIGDLHKSIEKEILEEDPDSIEKRGSWDADQSSPCGTVV